MKIQSNSNEYEGQCKFCEQDFSRKQIIVHLDNCLKRKKDKDVKNLRLRIVDPNMKNFWLIVEVNNQAKLKDLDNLIRKVWVECCGHLSLFGDYKNEISKQKIIMDILNPKDNLDYIYDFGSSTELNIEALGYTDCQLSKKKIELVARNYLPSSDCEKCGQQAKWVCTACINEQGASFICDKCAEKYHNEENEEEEHYLLPIANSPRCGVCGYESEEPLDKLF